MWRNQITMTQHSAVVSCTVYQIVVCVYRLKRVLIRFHSVLPLQKYRVDMPGSSSAFIPTINAITTSQDLQWMVQPTVITSMSNPYSRSHPYGLPVSNGPGLLGHTALTRPGVIRSIGDARGRRKRDEQVSPV